MYTLRKRGALGFLLSGGRNECLAESEEWANIPKTKPPATKITKAPYNTQKNLLALTVNLRIRWRELSFRRRKKGALKLTRAVKEYQNMFMKMM